MAFDAALAPEEDQGLGRALADLLAARLSDAPGVRVRDRQAMEPVPSAAELRPVDWQRLGRRWEVDYLVLGSVLHLGRHYVVHTRLFDVQRGVIVPGSSVVRACERKEDLYPAITALMRVIAYHLDYLQARRQAAPSPAREATKTTAAAITP